MNTISSIDDYGKITDIAMYPRDQWLYPVLGLADEAAEVLEKAISLPRPTNEELVKELGDVLWYANEIAVNLSGSLSNVVHRCTFYEIESRYDTITPMDGDYAKPRICELVVATGKIAGLFKKLVREDSALSWQTVLYGDRRMKIEEGIVDVLSLLATIAGHLGSSLQEVAQVNYDKLWSRQYRGTMLGDGDNR